MSEASISGSSTPTEHKSVTGRGGHRIESSRNFWDSSGLKVDSSSTDVAWCHGGINKILTSARNGELIMWDLNKNGLSNIYRWDLNMGQRGQLDRIPVAHSGPILSLDWIPPSSATATTVPSTRQSTSSTWYGGAIEEILPSAPIAGGASAAESDNTSPGWIVSGGMDRCVKVGTLKIILVLWRPGYECELAVVSNADFGAGTDFGHGSLPTGPSSASVGLGSGLATALSSPRLASTHLGGAETPGTPDGRAKSLTRSDGSDPVEIWDVRRGFIAKWMVNGSAVEGGVTDIEFGDSHSLWAVHQSGTFSQLDLRQSRKPLDAIPRTAISWNTTGAIAFVTDRPKRWEIPYDDIDPEAVKDKTPVKGLGDAPYHPTTQNVGAFVPEGAEEDLDMIEKLARGYIYEGKEKRLICAHNAEVALDVDAHDAAQTWLLLESLLTDLVTPPTPPLSPLPITKAPLPHSTSAPAAIPTINSAASGTPLPQRSITVDPSLYTKQKDTSPGSRSKYSDERYNRSTSGHRSPHKGTLTSSTASSPRKPSTGLPNVPASIFARRESGAGLPPPMRPRLPSSFRRPSFSTQSILSGHSESPSAESIRNSLRHVGEGALDDSDSSESSSDHNGTEGGDEPQANSDHEVEIATPTSATSASSSSRAPSASAAFLHRNTTANPSPLSRVAGKQTWTEDEKEDEDTPSPASTPESSGGEEDEYGYDASGDEHALAFMSASTSAFPSRRTSMVRMPRRPSARSTTRSRSSTVASLAVATTASASTTIPAPPPSPQMPSRRRSVARQESTSTIRTVTVEVGPAGRADGGLWRDETVRDLSGGRAASIRHARARSEARSDLLLDPERMGTGEVGAGMQTPRSSGRTSSDQTKAAVREAEERMRQLGWETVRERFEQYADQGDIIMCAVMALVVAEELKISKSRVARSVEAYIVCLHGGHQDCIRAYYVRRPADELSPPPQLAGLASLRVGRSLEANPPRGRAQSRAGSTLTGDGDSDDGASVQGEGTTGSFSSAKGVVVSSNMVLGQPCAAGCGHHCWAVHDKFDFPRIVVYFEYIKGKSAYEL
ncbi:hypothetical protein TRAPUB_10538 [Trametes pubescens]|uniref:Uncharacterized protein n=1 Tax=Trametes pubescens TaxID=154538 RepID=A0A1M2VZ73_TRAPU|nr:hypothetical protein TRAPUB_10538 [Trametes pubescens]